MIYRAISLVGILGSGLFVLTAQQPTSSGVFTSAQAEAGRLTGSWHAQWTSAPTVWEILGGRIRCQEFESTPGSQSNGVNPGETSELLVMKSIR